MNKYYLCEFLECNGEFEYNHHHIYSDKFLNKLGMKKIDNEENNDVEKNQVKLLNLFFANIKVEDVDEYLSNNDNFSEELDQKLGEAEFETGFGLNGNMNDFDEEHETRFDVYNSKGEATWGGHC